jgi:iron complex transport system permease protein
MEELIFRGGCSFLVGAILSQSGSLIQLCSRNILASPSTLGFDGLAIMWFLIIHVLATLFHMTYPLWISLLLGLVFFLLLGPLFQQLFKGNSKFERIILLGITFNLLVGAFFSLGQFLFLAFNLPFPSELWFGSFKYSDGLSLLILVLLEIVTIAFLSCKKMELRIFSIGPAVTLNWGIDEGRLCKSIFSLVAINTFVVVNLFGAFSFLGLIFPILARKSWFKKYDLAGEFLVGAMMNGVLLTMLDLGCYYFPIYGAEIPVGLIMTGIGAVGLIAILWLSFFNSENVAKPHK